MRFDLQCKKDTDFEEECNFFNATCVSPACMHSLIFFTVPSEKQCNAITFLSSLCIAFVFYWWRRLFTAWFISVSQRSLSVVCPPHEASAGVCLICDDVLVNMLRNRVQRQLSCFKTCVSKQSNGSCWLSRIQSRTDFYMDVSGVLHHG